MKHVTPMKAIRLKCLDCSDTSSEVKHCPVTDCPLRPYRFGRRPTTVKKCEEQKEAVKKGVRPAVPRGTEKDEFGNVVGTQASEINRCIIKGAKTVEAVAKKTGYSKSRIQTHLRSLSERGLITVDGDKIVRSKEN